MNTYFKAPAMPIACEHPESHQHESELVYSDFLKTLIVFIKNLSGHHGMWREHLKLVNALNEVVHLFYMPEMHSNLVPILVDFLYKGNQELQDASCLCFAKILKFQHQTESRKELLYIIRKEMYSSRNWIKRKAFLVFCKHTIKLQSRKFFETNFMKDFLNCSKDRIAQIRMEFVEAMLIIKPYFDKKKVLAN